MAHITVDTEGMRKYIEQREADGVSPFKIIEEISHNFAKWVSVTKKED